MALGWSLGCLEGPGGLQSRAWYLGGGGTGWAWLGLLMHRHAGRVPFASGLHFQSLGFLICKMELWPGLKQ